MADRNQQSRLAQALVATSRNRHVAFVSFSGLRVREQELLALGIQLPGLGNRRAAVAELPALALLTLAGRLPPHWTCSYHEVDKWDERLVDGISDERPCVVAVSALTAAVNEAYGFCRAIRNRGMRNVIGGLHATACPDEAIKHADAVVVGDGEPVWEQVLQDALVGQISGLYRANRPFDLNDSMPPRFDLAARVPRSRFTIQTQRGCPFACEFCAASRILGGFREKSPQVLGKELDALKASVSRPVLELADDNTFAGGRDHEKLLETLASANARYFTESDWRLGEQRELLKNLAASGCVQVLVGIESLIHAYRGFGNKKAELSRIMSALEAIQDHGVAVVGCFVLGADGETRSSVAQLTQVLLDCQLADVQVTLQTPFPGSPLRRRLQQAGRILPDRGWDYYTLFDVTFVPDSMTVSELEQAYRELAGLVYSLAENTRRLGIRRKIWMKSQLACQSLNSRAWECV
jgi:radical SAM superfamily enzyme YgiQ (UPF0313 family)